MSLRFTVKPSPVSNEDLVYRAQDTSVKRTVDMRYCDSVVDSQGDLNSCVGNAVANALEIVTGCRLKSSITQLSRLYVYYHARYIEDAVSEDVGVMYIKSALNSVRRYGICNETVWPYDIERYAQQPNPNCYADAFSRTNIVYEIMYSLSDMMESLSRHRPVVVGCEVFEEFTNIDESNPTVPLPKAGSVSLGGHAMAVLGYDLESRKFLAKNSFGENWGDRGYCWLPFDYVDQHVFERWSVDFST